MKAKEKSDKKEKRDLDNQSYSTVNGDPDITVQKITQTESNYDILADKTGRSVDKEENSGPLGLVTSIGQDKGSCVYGNDLRIKYPNKMGFLYPLLFYKDQPLICIGPQCKKALYIFIYYYITDKYAFFIFLFMQSINILISLFVYPEFNIGLVILGIFFYMFQTITHLFCLLVNPGIPHRKFYISESVLQSIYTYLEYTNSETFDKYKICKICNIYVPPDKNVIHCEDCNICIEDLDHHCNEIGKCVGKNYLAWYNSFILFTLLYLTYAFMSFIGILMTRVF